MRDLVSNISPVYLIAPATLAADNTPAAVDLRGFDSAAILLQIGVGGITFSDTNKVEFKLTHANDKADGSAPDAGDFTAVTIDDVQGIASVGTGGIIEALVAAHAAATITEIGYVGGKRWLKLLADFSGTHGTGTPISGLLVRGNAAQRPTA